MYRHFLHALALVLLISVPAQAYKIFPLEPPDTSSPRATFSSFIKYTDLLYEAAVNDDSSSGNSFLKKEYLQRAEGCFDLHEIPPTMKKNVGIESVLLLREILDRIEIPDIDSIPDNMETKADSTTLWRIPHTEIYIGRITKGHRAGSYLFTSETVDQLRNFYKEISKIPYRSDKGENYTGFYEQYIYSSGWLIPDGFLKTLPEWMMTGYKGQAVWQWISLILLFAVCSFVITLIWKFNRNRISANPESINSKRLIPPIIAMMTCTFIKYMAESQINITGDILRYLTIFLGAFFALFAAIAIVHLGNIANRVIISSAKISEDALDADVIRLLCQLCTFCLIFILFYKVGSHFGIPVTAIFASAGIAGVAVALAARETLANFFGGVSIFLDRPFRAGDYIVLDSGERGEVKTVGMRSTRLLTRGDVMISIPNSVITNAKIVNQSMPRSSFRVKIKVGVAYGSDIQKVEDILVSLAHKNELTIRKPEPRVRLIAFGDSALEFELHCWAKRPNDEGRLRHLLCKDIYETFNREGIEIPFPQREVHIKQSGNK